MIENYGTLSREAVTMKGAAIRRDDNMTQIRAREKKGWFTSSVCRTRHRKKESIQILTSYTNVKLNSPSIVVGLQATNSTKDFIQDLSLTV